jgi:hypothetical protein
MHGIFSQPIQVPLKTLNAVDVGKAKFFFGDGNGR